MVINKTNRALQLFVTAGIENNLRLAAAALSSLIEACQGDRRPVRPLRVAGKTQLEGETPT